MRRLRLCLATLWALATCMAAAARTWQPDVLGEQFEQTTIDQGRDYSGPVVSTVVRLTTDTVRADAVLYVHGFNDYFFQSEMAEEIVSHGYGFYAVDLRKYGRSLREGQQAFQVHDVHEYIADIDSALAVMREDGVRRVALMGHSTGGLISAVYMIEANPPAMIKGVILNSPFLDWNQSKLQEKFLIPLVTSVSGLCKGLKIPQGGSTGYAESLLRQYGGEWDYNTDWKLIQSPPVEASWIAAIDNAHDIVQRHGNIRVPLLLLHSDATVKKGDGPDDYACKDAVLDVEDISRYGRTLGVDVREVTIAGGLHDLALSAPAVRQLFYTNILDFLASIFSAK